MVSPILNGKIFRGGRRYDFMFCGFSIFRETIAFGYRIVLGLLYGSVVPRGIGGVSVADLQNQRGSVFVVPKYLGMDINKLLKSSRVSTAMLSTFFQTEGRDDSRRAKRRGFKIRVQHCRE